MAKDKGETVAVVREWKPQNEASLTNIHAQIDAMGRRAGEAPVRDYAEVEAAVDKLTKRVKTRKVTVRETVTEYVEVPHDHDVTAASSTSPSSAPPEPTTKLGWFARRKKGGEATPEPSSSHAIESFPAAAPAASDAWDPEEGRPIEAPKPLMSKAAKRTAGRKTAKKAGRKKR